MAFVLQKSDENIFFKNRQEMMDQTGLSCKNITAKIATGKTVKCKLGEGKVLKKASFLTFGKNKCSMCKEKRHNFNQLSYGQFPYFYFLYRIKCQTN